MKMRNKKKAQKKILKRTIVIAAIVVVLLAAAALYLIRFHGSVLGYTPFPKPTTSSTTSSINYDPPTKDESSAGTTIKQSTTDTSKPGSTSDSSSTDNTTTNVGISIPYVTPTGTNPMRVTTLIQKVTSVGTCTLTLSKSGQTSVTMTAGVQAQSQTSTCEGFSVPLTGLVAGTWNLKIDYTDGTNTGSVSTTYVVQ